MRDRNLFSSTITRPTGALMWIGAALVMLVLNFIFPQSASSVRSSVIDFLAPVIDVAGKSADVAQSLQGQFQDAAQLRRDNEALREEVSNLKTWAEAARQLEEENKRLKGLMHYADQSVVSFVTTRVIAETGGGFRNSIIVTAGSKDGVEKDMVALDENGVVGRVIEVGTWSSRVLLFNDLNFRLPVLVEEADQRAILAGQARNAPRLLFAPHELEMKTGMRVVTSGHGGIFPPGLPVGVVKEVNEGNVTIDPYGRLDRLDMVRLARYQLPDEPKASASETPQKASSPSPKEP